MIKANELRVGNWVIVDYVGDPAFYHRIIPQDIYNNFHESYTAPDWIRPIPLTPEILEQSGFKKDRHGWNLPNTKFSLTEKLYPCWLDRMLWPQDIEDFKDCSIKYLHQLQNLYLWLSGGEELTINFKDLTYQ